MKIYKVNPQIPYFATFDSENLRDEEAGKLQPGEFDNSQDVFYQALNLFPEGHPIFDDYGDSYYYEVCAQ